MGGVGDLFNFSTSKPANIPTRNRPISFMLTLLRTLLQLCKTQLVSFQQIPNSFTITTGWWGRCYSRALRASRRGAILLTCHLSYQYARVTFRSLSHYILTSIPHSFQRSRIPVLQFLYLLTSLSRYLFATPLAFPPHSTPRPLCAAIPGPTMECSGGESCLPRLPAARQELNTPAVLEPLLETIWVH